MQMELSNKMIQDLVNRRHPDYELRKAHWDLSQPPTPVAAWFKDNIFRYFKEGDAEFKSAGTRLPV
jgi:hypothetical protein